MSALVDLIRNSTTKVVDNKWQSISDIALTGTTLTTPSLIYTDGVSLTYAVDVDIGREAIINENGDLGNLPLYNVPIASGNRELIYAEVGTAVTVKRNAKGWEVVGFAKTQTGTFHVTDITLPLYCLTTPTQASPGLPILHLPVIGETKDISIGVRKLTYGELATYGTYGNICYGASATFVGSELTNLTCG